jgi:hypothetical protein
MICSLIGGKSCAGEQDAAVANSTIAYTQIERIVTIVSPRGEVYVLRREQLQASKLNDRKDCDFGRCVW